MPATEPTFAPKQMHNISVVIDAAGANVEFRSAIQSFSFTPSSTVSTTTGGTPNAVFTDVSPATWTCVIKFLQDIEKSGSLQNYMIANAGQRKTVDFIPTGGAKVSATLVLTAPPIGGDMNTWLDASVTCGVVGVPTISGSTP